jgi:hypothetical protein
MIKAGGQTRRDRPKFYASELHRARFVLAWDMDKKEINSPKLTLNFLIWIGGVVHAAAVRIPGALCVEAFLSLAGAGRRGLGAGPAPSGLFRLRRKTLSRIGGADEDRLFITKAELWELVWLKESAWWYVGSRGSSPEIFCPRRTQPCSPFPKGASFTPCCW